MHAHTDTHIHRDVCMHAEPNTTHESATHDHACMHTHTHTYTHVHTHRTYRHTFLPPPPCLIQPATQTDPNFITQAQTIPNQTNKLTEICFSSKDFELQSSESVVGEWAFQQLTTVKRCDTILTWWWVLLSYVCVCVLQIWLVPDSDACDSHVAAEEHQEGGLGCGCSGNHSQCVCLSVCLCLHAAHFWLRCVSVCVLFLFMCCVCVCEWAFVFAQVCTCWALCFSIQFCIYV